MIVNVNDFVPKDSDKLYRYEKVNADGTGTGEYLYLKYAPGELMTEPTVINRELLMAMQGFTACTTTFNSDGSITEVGTTGTKTTVFNADGTIDETFSNTDGVTITKRTSFNDDGTISETLS